MRGGEGRGRGVGGKEKGRKVSRGGWEVQYVKRDNGCMYVYKLCTYAPHEHNWLVDVLYVAHL